jgi:hypothetical protein
MAYKVQIRNTIQRRIVAWNLPDPVFVEVLLRLKEDLAENPFERLVRLRSPFEGMVYHFSMVDPTNRLREFTFLFHVEYGQDEETLRVVNCAYRLLGL